MIDQVCGTGAGRLAPFADMLVVHELAHAFHDGVPFVFPRVVLENGLLKPVGRGVSPIGVWPQWRILSSGAQVGGGWRR